MATRRLGKIGLVAADSEHIEHGLSRVGVAAIARVEDGDMWLDMAGDEFRRTALLMPHYKHVALHGFDIPQGIQQAFALDRR